MGAVVPQRKQKWGEKMESCGKIEKRCRYNRGVWLRWSSRGDTKGKKKVEKLGKLYENSKVKREVCIVGVCGCPPCPPHI